MTSLAPERSVREVEISNGSGATRQCPSVEASGTRRRLPH